jgi:hypothetical protein
MKKHTIADIHLITQAGITCNRYEAKNPFSLGWFGLPHDSWRITDRISAKATERRNKIDRGKSDK